MPEVTRLVLIRHAESDANRAGILNGDPSVPVALTPGGRAQATAAGRALSAAAFDLAVHTRFPRTLETLRLVLDGREVRTAVCPDLDDVDVGVFEGRPLRDYREWRAGHGPDDAPPGGESRIAAMGRYVRGFERLLAAPARHVLAVLHDVPIRFLLNAVHDADPIAGPHQSVPNAVPFTLRRDEVEAGLRRMRQRIGADDAG